MFELTFLPGGMPPADPKRAGYRKTIPGPYPYELSACKPGDVTIAYTAEMAALIGDARAVLSALAVRYDGLSQEKEENCKGNGTGGGGVVPEAGGGGRQRS